MRVVQLALALSSSKRVFRARFDARRARLGTSVTAQMALAVFLMLSRESAATPPPLPPHCNVLVAGGSTAALAAAITAAVAGPNLTVCLTEPTDTLGGQLAFNPAIDFGDLGSTAAQGAELKALVAALKPPQHSPSPCWVSTACYPPARLAAWIARRLSTLPNLTVLRRTAVLGTRRDNATGRVLGLELVSRAPINNGGAEDGQDEWGARLSDSLPDWYSPLPSVRFTKASGVVAADVVVEATELGDVLVTAGLPFTQGVEIPTERSLTTDDGLTQSVSFAFFAQLLPAPSPPDPAPQGGDGVDSGAPPFWGAPPGKSCCCSGSNEVSPPPANTCHGKPMHNTSCVWAGQCSWGGVWRYRRSVVGGQGSSPVAGVDTGDVSMQNWGHGNDMPAACILAPVRTLAAEVASGWAGGVNLSAIRLTEDRAFGWFRALQHAEPGIASRLVLNREYPNSSLGLTKFPYVRDTRRAVGLGGFRMNHTMMMAHSPRKTGPPWPDTIGLGGYNFDIKPGAGFGASNGGQRPLPSYIWNTTTNSGLAGTAAPFYFPLRAATVGGAPNVLAAGKTAALTFAANTAARVHTGEFSMGVGVGAAAAVMALRGWNSTKLLEEVEEVQALLRSPQIGQPLSWE